MDSDPLPILLSIIMVLLLVFANGFFVAAEYAFVKVKNHRIEALALEGNVRAKISLQIMNNLNAYLSACQLGITLASLALGWIGGPAIAIMIEPFLRDFLPYTVIQTISFIIAFSLIAILHITIGEQVPKKYAIRQSENVTLLSAIPVVAFYRITYPLIWLLNGASNWMLRRTEAGSELVHESVHTDEEIRLLMQESHENGFMNETEYTLVDNIFNFSDTTAKEIKIPRTEMICLYANLSFEENRDIAIKEMLTRYPVCNPDKDNIIGFVHIKDLLKSYNGLKDIRSIIRPLTSVPESVPISTLLQLMQQKKTQMTLLLDEYGGTSGMITIEDILEEIVGEIQDEFDKERPSIEENSDDSYSIDGLLRIEQVNEYFDLDIDAGDYDTIGGWMYSQIEIPPEKDNKIEHSGFEFIIEEVDHMRIARIVIRKQEIQNETVA